MNLNQITLPSRDVRRSMDFYRKMGLVLIVDSAPRYVRFEMPKGASTLSVHHVEDFEPENGIHLYFECDVDRKFKSLSALGFTFEDTPEDKRWLWREVRLKDPDGHLIILFSAGENRKNPPWRAVG